MVPKSPNRRTEMDDGAIAVTARHSRVRTVIMVRWRLTPAQYELLGDFWERDLSKGTAWFSAPVFEGLRVRHHDARFAAEDPFTSSSPLSGVFEVATELELRERPRLTQAERIAIDTSLRHPEDMTDIVAAMSAIADRHEELPSWP